MSLGAHLLDWLAGGDSAVQQSLQRGWLELLPALHGPCRLLLLLLELLLLKRLLLELRRMGCWQPLCLRQSCGNLVPRLHMHLCLQHWLLLSELQRLRRLPTLHCLRWLRGLCWVRLLLLLGGTLLRRLLAWVHGLRPEHLLQLLLLLLLLRLGHGPLLGLHALRRLHQTSLLLLLGSACWLLLWLLLLLLRLLRLRLTHGLVFCLGLGSQLSPGWQLLGGEGVRGTRLLSDLQRVQRAGLWELLRLLLLWLLLQLQLLQVSAHSTGSHQHCNQHYLFAQAHSAQKLHIGAVGGAGYGLAAADA